MYLNVYQQMLQRGGGVSVFFRQHRGEACATALVMSRMTRAFIEAIEKFAEEHKIPIIPLEKGVRKERRFSRTSPTLRGPAGCGHDWQGSRESDRLPHDQAALCQNWQNLPLADEIDGDGQPLLFLLRRPGVWPVLHQVLLVRSCGAGSA